MYVEKIATNLSSNGHDVSILTNQLRQGIPTFNLLASEEMNGVKVIRLPIIPANIGRGWPSVSPFLAKSLLRIRPEVVHVHGLWPYYATNAALILARVTGMKSVLTPHYHPSRGGRIRFLDKSVHLRILRIPDHIIAITEAEQGFYQSLGLRNVSCIPNPVEFPSVDERRIAQIKQTWNLGNHVLLTVGRLSKGKRFEFAINLLSDLSERIRDLQLVIVGEDWGTKSLLRRQADELGLSDRVLFFENASNSILDALYSLSSVVIVTARYEAFGRTIIEALVHGKPVVAFASAGTIDALSDGGGTLVHDASEFREAVLQILEAEQAPLRNGNVSREPFMRKYAIETVVQAHEAVYNSVIG